MDRFCERLAEISLVAMIDGHYGLNISAEELASTPTASALEALVAPEPG